jgi:hypothetical protein
MVPLVARLAALAAAVLWMTGCAPDCRKACRHLLEDCGVERTDWGLDDCTAGCNAYLTHYEDDWQKEQSWQGVRCVARASCDDLRSGTPCYDEATYIW